MNVQKSLSGLLYDVEPAACHGPPPTFAARLTIGLVAATTPAMKAAAQSHLILESISVTSFARSLMQRASEGALIAP